jgi:TP901 family phage tail tape measure protein
MSEPKVEIKITAIDEATKKIEEIKKSFEGFDKIGSLLQNVGGQLAGIGAAISAPIMAATKSFADFEQSIISAGNYAKATASEFEAMEKAASAIGNAPQYSSTQVAEAMNLIAQSGNNAVSTMKAVEAATTLATASQKSLTESAGIVAEMIDKFGLSADEAASGVNTLYAAAQNSSASLDDITESMLSIAPTTKALGLSMTDTAAALMKMSERGVAGTEAATALRMALSTLAAPTTETIAVLKEMGVSAEQVNPQMNSLADIIKVLQAAGIDGAKAIELFGNRVGSYVAPLFATGAQSVDYYTQSLKNSATAAEDAADKMDNTLGGVFKRIKATFSTIAADIGKAVVPIVQKFASVIQNVLSWWKNLDDGLKDGIVRFGLIAGAVATVAGGLTAMVGTIMKLVDTWKSFAVIMNTAFNNIPGIITSITTKLVSMGATITGVSSTASTAGKAINLAFGAGAVSLVTALGGYIVWLTAKFVDAIAQIRNISDEWNKMYNMDFGGNNDVFAAWNKSSNELQQSISLTQAAFGKLRKEAGGLSTDNVEEQIAVLSNTMLELAERAIEAGGGIKAFGDSARGGRLDEVTEQIAAIILEMEKFGVSASLIDEWRTKWGQALPDLDKTLDKSKDLSKAMEDIGISANSATEEISAAMAGLTGDTGLVIDNLKKIDFTSISNNASETADAVYKAFRDAGMSSADALKAINNLNFNPLSIRGNEIAKAITGIFESTGKDAARSLGVINELEFSSLDDKVTNLSESIFRTLTDLGIDSKVALEAINKVNYDPLKQTTEEARQSLIEIFEAAGYSAEEAQKEVNKFDLKKMKTESESASSALKTEFSDVKKTAIEEFNEINSISFDRLKYSLSSAVESGVNAATQKLQALLDMIKKVNDSEIKIVIDAGGV